MQSMVAWAHLHKWVKQATANFQDLPPEMVGRPPFAGLLALSTQIEECFERNPHFARPTKREAWLTSWGSSFAATSVRTASAPRGPGHAKELRETRWQVAQDLRTIPYIDGKPAGTARPVEGRRGVSDPPRRAATVALLAPPSSTKIGRAFERPEIGDAVKFCFDREPTYVTAYMEATSELPRATRSNRLPRRNPLTPISIPSGGGPGGDQRRGVPGPEPIRSRPAAPRAGAQACA